MVTKKPTDQSNDNFRQQDSTTRKLNKDHETAGQRQTAQTASVIDNDKQPKSQGQKHFPNQTNQPVNGSQQQENTGSKLNRPIGTTEQQFSQSTSGNGESKLQNQHSPNDNAPQNNQGNLRKQFSNEATDDFRQHESTTSKLNRPIETAEQQQLSQSTSVVGNSGNGERKLQNQHLPNDNAPQNNQAKRNQGNLRKRVAVKENESFRQQESTTKKLDKPLTTAGKRQSSQTAKVTSENNGTNSKIQKSKSGVARQRFKLVAKSVGNGTLVATTDTLKKGASSYQEQLERDDDGVEVVSQGARVVGKLSRKGRQKLREKKLKNKKFVKAKENPLSKEKNVSSLKKIATSPAVALKKGMVGGTEKYRDQLEQGDEGVKLASQGATQVARASNKLKKSISKISSGSGKLGRKNSKLTQRNFNKSNSIKVKSKAALKKKAIRKKMYAPQRAKSRVAASAMSSMSNRIKGLIKGLGKINLNSIKNAIGAKVGLWAGAGLISILPYILGAAVVLILLVAILGGGADQESQPQIGGVHSLSPGVEQWRELVEREAAAQGMSAYVSLLLAIIQVETGGVGTRDIMQSSESAGHPRNYWQTEELSVRQGVKHLKSIVNILEGFGAGFESNSKLLAQAYNFGSAFAGYVGRQGGEYSLDIAEQYSKNVVAPSLGNYTGITYSYVNAVSNNLGKPYLYRNGGNFMYGDLVAQYISPYAEGELAPPAQPLWVTSHFGGRDSPGGVGSTDHRGIDFACSEFVTPILTVLEGTVHRSGIIGGLGNALVIKHNDNFYTTYGHMSSLNVKAGDTVRTGQQIGVCGNTGTSTGPHLHFEVAPDASFTNQIDPYPYFQHLLGG